MNVYDLAHQLASELKRTDEYTSYMHLKTEAYADDTNKALLEEYKRMQFKMQARAASGEQMSREDMEKLQRIASLLQFNEDARDYMLAEFRFQRLISEIYKIIGEAAGIDLDSLLNA